MAKQYDGSELSKKPWFNIQHYDRRKLLFMPDKYVVRHEVLEGSNPGKWSDYYYKYKVGEDVLWRRITHLVGPLWIEFGYPLYDDSWSKWMDEHLEPLGRIKESFFTEEDTGHDHWWERWQ